MERVNYISFMEWISILKCPITGQELRELRQDEIVSLNEKIKRGEVMQTDGKPFTGPLEKGLVSADELGISIRS